jgi:hypothetical protein
MASQDRASVISGELYELLTGDEEGRLCKDIPDSACRHQGRNFFTHIASLAATKTGDGLADPKLVLAWLLNALGAPAVTIGLLVPIRESLALIPQLFTAASIRSLQRRKWAWAAGSAVQGLCVLGMALAALTLEGAPAGWTILGLLAIFASARSVCSVSYKDVLGKTVSKQSRGTATGTAGSLAAAAILIFGVLLSTGLVSLTVTNVSIALIIAGVLWLFASILFLQIAEEQGATEGGANAIGPAFEQIGLLKSDPQLARFIVTRGLLIATALAPPFILTLAGESGRNDLAALGPFVIASSLASILSSYVWGQFADKSSRWVLIVAALNGAFATVLAGLIGIFVPSLTADTYLMAGILFILVIAYQGVRLGRSTHLVDMADEDKRASYTALSNTAIGLLLLLGGAFGLLAEIIGTPGVLLLFSLMCFGAAWTASGLEEVQQD